MASIMKPNACSADLDSLWRNLPALKMSHLIGRPLLYGDLIPCCQLSIQCSGRSSHKERDAAAYT